MPIQVKLKAIIQFKIFIGNEHAPYIKIHQKVSKKETIPVQILYYRIPMAINDNRYRTNQFFCSSHSFALTNALNHGLNLSTALLSGR